MIVSPSGASVISLHHQLLTASAHLRHRSRMQCNAGIRKTALLRFCIQPVPYPCRSNRRSRVERDIRGSRTNYLCFAGSRMTRKSTAIGLLRESELR
jgi:hypothetical protein